jgi:ribosomal protein L44E
MEIDTIRKGYGHKRNFKPRKFSKEQQKRRKDGTCYECGEKGHFTKDYKKKKSVNTI